MSEKQKLIGQLIINSPYSEPREHWKYDPVTQGFDLASGRRQAGYIIASQRDRAANDPGMFVEIPLVNRIRPRVRAWRDKGYPGVTGITKRLLAHWQDPELSDKRRFFFCQLEAIETLIWLVEGHPSEREGLTIPSDDGPFQRLCSKMATGTGKTIVMSMVAAWQILNKVVYSKDTRFSKNILVVTPGLTVRSRLGVLDPKSSDNYYDRFDIVPASFSEPLRQGAVHITNWHSLGWDSEEVIQKRRSVDKRGPLSDEAYIRDVLGDLSGAKDIVVLNDEAHHAWRVPAESKIKGVKKEEIEEATVWVNGLDRIARVRGIGHCFDFSATPYAPTGKTTAEGSLFPWIVSDFGLNDAIESGLVKTPRVVVRDNGKIDPKTFKSQLYHIYDNEEVKADLNRKALPTEPLPPLVVNAYMLLGYDWLETQRAWKEAGSPVPPVMISAVNTTETAARVKYSFDHKKIRIEELCQPTKTIHIDSSVLDNAEALRSDLGDSIDLQNLSKQELAELHREKVDTVGQMGKSGQFIQNVISVGMLTEGWDAKTVTHIMGLRAFSSQLLCEQVIGRGLRRTSYEVDPVTGLFQPEYVNVFGIPFSYLPFEGSGESRPAPAVAKLPIFPDPEKSQYKIQWPNLIRVEHSFSPALSIELSQLSGLELKASDVVELAELAPTIDGKPNLDKIKVIELEKLAREFRQQKVIFEVARDLFDQMNHGWSGDKGALLSQLIAITQKFIESDRYSVKPESYAEDELKRNLLITLSMNKVVQYLFEHIRFQNTLMLQPVFDERRPILSTEDAGTWHTSRPCQRMKKTHMNLCVVDSTWEQAAAQELDRSDLVEAWVKNDHLNFEIIYLLQGTFRRYIPDFIVKLRGNRFLILEVKGQETDRDRTKWGFLNEWVQAVNDDGRFGTWSWDVSFDASAADLKKILKLAVG